MTKKRMEKKGRQRERGKRAGNARACVRRDSRMSCAERERDCESESESESGRKDANPAHLEEGVQVIGQLGVTACVSTPLWQSHPNGKRRGPASSECA